MASKHPYINAVVGSWYQSTEQNLYFEVVAVDIQSGNIEVQLLDGEVMDFDSDSWQESLVTPAQPPEDATAAYEMSNEDRYGDESASAANSWDNPLANIEPDSYPSIDDF